MAGWQFNRWILVNPSIDVIFGERTETANRLLKCMKNMEKLAFSKINKTVVFKEFMEFAGKLSVERSATSTRSSIKEQDYFLHCYIRSDNLAGLCVTDNEYQARVAFSMLTKVMDEFEQAVPASKWPLIQSEKDCQFTKLNELLIKWQNPHEADALTRVQDEVQETKIVLHNTIQAVLDRGEKLDDIVRQSESLSESSKIFYTQARKMNKCCNWV